MSPVIIINCRSCGASNVEESPFCHICGEPMRYELNATYSGSIWDKIKGFFTPTSLSAFAVLSEVVGVDISEYQGIIDFDKLRLKAQYAVIRAGAGNTYTDAKLTQNYMGCVERGIVPELYWFVKPDKDALKTAEAFFTQWEKFPTKLPPVHDVEISGGLAKTALDSWLTKYLNRFNVLSGLKPENCMIYTSAYFWNTFVGITGWEKYYLLWAAHWTTASSPLLPNAWSKIQVPKTWTYWQYSSKGKGSDYGAQSQYIDLDRYNGTLASFNQRWGVHAQPLPTAPTPSPSASPSPSPSPSPSQMPDSDWCITDKVIVQTLNVRNGPSTSYAVVGTLPLNTVVDVSGIDGTDVWAQIKTGQYSGKWICVKTGGSKFSEITIE